ncbi:hypothetical protein [Rhizobium paranaense]|uniref:Uncharacterized protein n=1 Tax=Rhizobium paranaense TaxID=1650438 RepID=A0A7W8XSL3_9HYPH|nr:hypothetical protein [Rhizobium paranaense]MBB5574810.1 hypothetical protein [Rhizobium paranaense]
MELVTACFDYGQLDEVDGLAASSCFNVVVFFDVDIPLQSFAFPLLLAPLPIVPLVLLPLVVLALEPLVLFVPLSDPEPEVVDAPEPVPEPDALPVLPDCWANADVARPTERADTARIFKNMIFLLGCSLFPTSNKCRSGMFQNFPVSDPMKQGILHQRIGG